MPLAFRKPPLYGSSEAKTIVKTKCLGKCLISNENGNSQIIHHCFREETKRKCKDYENWIQGLIFRI